MERASSLRVLGALVLSLTGIASAGAGTCDPYLAELVAARQHLAQATATLAERRAAREDLARAEVEFARAIAKLGPLEDREADGLLGIDGVDQLQEARAQANAWGRRRHEVGALVGDPRELADAESSLGRLRWEIQRLEAAVAGCSPTGWKPTPTCPYVDMGPQGWYREETLRRGLQEEERRRQLGMPPQSMEQMLAPDHPQPRPSCVEAEWTAANPGLVLPRP